MRSMEKLIRPEEWLVILDNRQDEIEHMEGMLEEAQNMALEAQAHRNLLEDTLADKVQEQSTS